MNGDDPQFGKEDLFRQLDTKWLSRTRSASSAASRTAASVDSLITATAARDRADARARFSVACFVVAICVIAIAIFLRLDGLKIESYVTLLLCLLPLIGGGWHLDRANREKRRIANELERLRSSRSLDES